MIAFPLAGGAHAGDCRSTPSAGVDWSRCAKKNLMLTSSDFSKANLVEADLSATDLRDSDFTGANLSKAKLARAWLGGARAEKANFEKVEGYRTGFQKMDAEGASFGAAELQRANFQGANLKGVSFEKAELSRVIFDQAILTGTSFNSANLARADLTKAVFEGPLDFSNAFLSLTRVEGVDLSSSIGIEQHQLDMACGDDKTKLPPGLNAPQSWPCADKD
nr:pentapeptide repeat-containing protein [Neorhizobium lilium]